MKEIKYRILKQGELGFLAEIDREEKVAQEYYIENGELKLKDQHYIITCWNSIELAGLIKRLYYVYENDGAVYGAFVNGDLIGMIALNTIYSNEHDKKMLLDQVYISKDYRSQGVGQKLFSLIEDEAKQRGAEYLYISAHPFKNTVDYYLKLGAVINKNPDEVLLKANPDDIHLIYKIK